MDGRQALAPCVLVLFFFLGVYLPLLWEQSFCWKSPIALGYTRGHFSALVAMENDGYGNRGAGANLNTDDDVTITFLPLVDSERKLLHVHFLSAQEVSSILLSQEPTSCAFQLCVNCDRKCFIFFCKHQS